MNRYGLLPIPPLEAEIIADLMQKLHHAVISGNPTPYQAQLHERMTHPVVGDLVVVDAWNQPASDRVGQFIGTEWGAPEKWDEKVDGPAPQVEYKVLHLLATNRRVRWANCALLACPLGVLTP